MNEYSSIVAATFQDEEQIVKQLLKDARVDYPQAAIKNRARDLIAALLKKGNKSSIINDFITQYGLTNKEGILLMCLAEAMLRVPDHDTIDELIKDKITSGEWNQHLGKSDSLIVNASTWALLFTGKIYNNKENDLVDSLKRVVHKMGEPVVRRTVKEMLKVMGKEFVFQEDIKSAVNKSCKGDLAKYRFSFDMLGEGARNQEDAQDYWDAYLNAINAIGNSKNNTDNILHNPSISVKLSAIDSRYFTLQKDVFMPRIFERIKKLCLAAKAQNIALTIDAEEATRLEYSLEIIKKLCYDDELKGWNGLGLAVQAYSKRATHVLEWLANLARDSQQHLAVRLVKGAYWDSEIKWAQQFGLPEYPVFTRKATTDVSYVACAKVLLANNDVLFPQFATHNAYSYATVRELVEGKNYQYEFQRLHGMGEEMYEHVMDSDDVACRIYAPVGTNEDLLSYLMRRLLENGANSSFVYQLADEDANIEDMLLDPLDETEKLENIRHHIIPLPIDLYRNQEARNNSKGHDLNYQIAQQGFLKQRDAFSQTTWNAGVFLDGKIEGDNKQAVYNPAKLDQVVGEASESNAAQIEKAISQSVEYFAQWSTSDIDARCAALNKMADLLETHMPELCMMCQREAGKTIDDAIAEVREAVDFCRYYALQAKQIMTEQDTQAVGVFVCISPWNFPLAIFIGQIAAALVSGNCVIAKPAEQTPLIATRAAQLFIEAGIAPKALSLLPGDGPNVGAKLISDPRIAGVVFTGSVEVARLIRLNMPRQAILIAETGGLNAMIVDSTALPEQVIDDVYTSAFQSAGQRCSALRMLFVQNDIADKMIRMIKGNIDEIIVDDPLKLSTHVGPVIDNEALNMLQDHQKQMSAQGKFIHQAHLAPELKGHYFAPMAVELNSLADIKTEKFGPILHVVRYQANKLDTLINDINAKGYGLTAGIHTRIDKKYQDMAERLNVGNLYINRNVIGAVVGVQPFGGEGLSGTGPKAGGPAYLLRFMRAKKSTDQSMVFANFTQSAAAKKPQSASTDVYTNAAIAFKQGQFFEPLAYKNQLEKLNASITSLGLSSELLNSMSATLQRYYTAHNLPGPTGENNMLVHKPKGVYLMSCDHNDANAIWAALMIVASKNTLIILSASDEMTHAFNQMGEAFEKAGFEKNCLQVIESSDDALLDQLMAQKIVGLLVCQDQTTKVDDLLERLFKCEGAILTHFNLHHDEDRPLRNSHDKLVLNASFITRMIKEQTVTINTTASGGNAQLLASV